MATHEIYASCVAVTEDAGLLFIGESGSGKSDIALRLIDAGSKLISDDRVALMEEGGELFASPTHKSAGLIELRGLGVFRLAAHQCAPRVRIVAAIHCDNLTPPRLQDPLEAVWCGVALPFWRMRVLDASSVSKLKILVQSLLPESKVFRV
jgi:HPr kinase/phosphorylase